jgi:hypothetical protein
MPCKPLVPLVWLAYAGWKLNQIVKFSAIERQTRRDDWPHKRAVTVLATSSPLHRTRPDVGTSGTIVALSVASAFRPRKMRLLVPPSRVTRPTANSATPLEEH